MIKICVPVTGMNMKEIESQLREMALLEFDMIEWRGDYFFSMEALELIKSSFPEKEFLFTIRTKEEGGEFQQDERHLSQILFTAARSDKVDIIDLELEGICKTNPEIIGQLRNLGVKLLISNHDFEKTPSKEELIDRYKKMESLGGDIGKIAVMPHTPEDIKILVEAAKEVGEVMEMPIVAISMGELGMETRIKGIEFGSIITFGCLEKASAPGQISVKELNEKIKAHYKQV